MKYFKKIMMLCLSMASIVTLRANDFCALESGEAEKCEEIAVRAPRPSQEDGGQAVVGPCGACAAQIISTITNVTESSGGGDGNFASLTVDPGDVTVTQGDVIVALGDIEVTAGSITAGNGLVATAGGANITGATTLNGGVVNIGTDANGNAINIGTAGARTITIGNAAGTGINLIASAGGPIIADGSTFNLLTDFVVSDGIIRIDTPGDFLQLPDNVRLIPGTGDPNGVVSGGQGSLFLRIDGSTTNDRAYINTNGGTAWTAITTAS
jgi:hypothetical protein